MLKRLMGDAASNGSVQKVENNRFALSLIHISSRAEKRKEKQKMYTVTFSNEELEEMKANDAVVIVSCDDDNGHRLY